MAGDGRREGGLGLVHGLVDARGMLEGEAPGQAALAVLPRLSLSQPQGVLTDHPDGRRRDDQRPVAGVAIGHEQVGLGLIVADADAEAWEMGEGPDDLTALEGASCLDAEGQAAIPTVDRREILEDVEHGGVLERGVVLPDHAQEAVGVGSADRAELGDRVQGVGAAQIDPLNGPVQTSLADRGIGVRGGLGEHGATVALPGVHARRGQAEACRGRRKAQARGSGSPALRRGLGVMAGRLGHGGGDLIDDGFQRRRGRLEDVSEEIEVGHVGPCPVDVDGDLVLCENGQAAAAAVSGRTTACASRSSGRCSAVRVIGMISRASS